MRKYEIRNQKLSPLKNGAQIYFTAKFVLHLRLWSEYKDEKHFLCFLIFYQFHVFELKGNSNI